MKQSIWDIVAIPLGYIMRWCYILVEDILHLPLSYVFALFLFTLITKILMFPLSIKQQKSTAKMSVFQPMVTDIQKKYATDKKKQEEELLKLQEMGYSPTTGCLPMLIQFPILFGLIEVIYEPLSYMLRIPKELIATLTEKTNAILGADLAAKNARMIETYIIEQVKTNGSAFADLFASHPEEMQAIVDLNMSVGPLNLWEKPTLGMNWSIIIPIISVLTMFLSTRINMRTSGQDQMQGNAKMMNTSMSLMFAVFSFMYPAGFSLYWSFQNIILIFQSLLLKKIIDPDKIKEETIAKMKEAKKQSKKRSQHTVKIRNEETGVVEEKSMSLSELDKIRMQRAREIDAERYGDE